MKPNLFLTINIKGPEELIFEGKADALSSVNERGPFDILPLHINFISIIKDVIVIYSGHSKIKEIAIGNGVIRVMNNTVNIYLGIETVS